MTDPISQAREVLAQQKAYETVCGYPDSDLTQALAALIEHTEQVERERNALRTQAQAAHDALTWMAVELGWATDGRLDTAVRHAQEILRVRTAERDEWKATAEARTQTTDEEEVLVEGSWFKRSDLPEVLGNFMRSSAEYAREAKEALVTMTELRSTIVTDEMVEQARKALVRVDSVYLPRKIIRRALEAALGGES